MSFQRTSRLPVGEHPDRGSTEERTATMDWPLDRRLIDEVDLHVLPRLLGDRPACTTSRMGPCAGCTSWVADDPNAASNLRFRATYEN